MVLLNSGIGNYILSNGKEYSYFGGNNYLGLAGHPDLKEASIRSINKYGVNFSASRCTTGTADIHLDLEKELAAFKGKQDAVVFASGYQGNTMLLDILKDRYSAIFMDQYSHPSIYAGIPRDISIVHQYKHCDAENLENLLQRTKRSKPLIITDGIFALTGEISALDEIYLLAEKYNALLVVDDAHSTGVLGENGRGTPEHFRLPQNENIFQVETMSKAIGSYGGFIAGSKDLTDLIRKKSAIYKASTALPPPLMAASIASINIIKKSPELRHRVLEKASALRLEIMNMGFSTTPGKTPIIPVMFSKEEVAKDLENYLENNGIIAPFINYPVKQVKYLIRIAVTANHTNEQLEFLLDLMKRWKTKNA